ncbi:pentapeptide repeat-containing protein [Cellvibrio sp.]|uniref:pentapeptide repeat-containing protein n=1 Tax=Cellvibrio sp. TaxID=1965322 RepID=UPI0039648838
MTKPVVHQNPLYDLLRSEQVEEFNQRKAAGELNEGQLRGGDFRGLDLRGLDANGLDLRDAYFRGADLRGIDFRNTNLEGASFCQAHISGCFFPKELSADEIRLSFDLGIRVRYRTVVRVVKR